MTKTRITISLLIILCSTLPAYSQSWPSALLWRISGNGLQQPSYLYGTMHLTDRRLFFFSDSLYKALETSEGFAMEIDPNEMMDSLLSRISDDKSPLLKELMNDKEYKKIEKKLAKKLGVPADKITRKKLAAVRRHAIYKNKKPDDMKAAVDLYLFDLAQRMGKYVGGIEDVNDQMDVFDELGGDVNINELIKDIDDEGGVEEYKEKMIGMYVKEDIGTINKMIGSGGSELLSLIKRNIKMARRMDSLAHTRNSFFAVGAAHLPGDSGVIALLRNKGFIVEPVNSVNKIAPEKYTVSKKATTWYQVAGADSIYTIEMPGKASDMNMFGDELKFKTYVDLAGGNKVYMAGAVFIPEGDSALINERMEKSFSKQFEKLQEKKIIHLGMEGKELISTRETYYYRMQLFSTYDKFYMVMCAGEKKEQLYTEEAAHFFQSFRPNTGTVAKTKNWTEYTDSLKAFTVSLPGKVKITRSAPEENGSHTEINVYSVFDIKNATYYILSASETEKGYQVTDDSLVFNSQRDNYTSRGLTVSEKRSFEMNGFPAMSFTIEGEKEGTKIFIKLLIISRGNRSYSLTVITEKAKEYYPDITKFFRSFSLLPYKSSAWQLQQPSNKTFSIWAPSVVDTIAKDNETTVAATETRYVSFDSVTANNYYIIVSPFSKYFHTKNDSTFLAGEIATYYNDTASYTAKDNPGNFDSLVSMKAVTNGKANGFEIVVKNASKLYYKRTRLLRNADSSYTLFALIPYSTLYNENTNRFFESFRFTNEDAPTTIFTNKTNLLLNDLLSADSATLADAKVALSDREFSGDDLPLLHQAFLKEYPKDSVDYTSIPERLQRKIELVDSAATISFVKENYFLLPAKSDKRMMMLEMLASQQNAEAITLLKEFLLNKQALQGSSSPRGIIYDLNDSLLLAKHLFPEAASLFSDTVLGPGFISVAVNLIDSGFAGKELITGNKAALLTIAARQLKNLKQPGEDYFEWGSDVTRALGIIGDNDAVKILNQLAAVKDLETKKDALVALAKLNKPVPATEIRKLAVDKYYRLEFYDLLKKESKQSLYPKEFLTQQKFAEGYLAMAASEEDMDSEKMFFTLLGEKTTTFKGVPSRFYVFKVVAKYEDEKYEYPAVCGPFDMNKTKVEIKEGENWSRIFYDDKVPAATAIGKLFDKFLEEIKSEEANR